MAAKRKKGTDESLTTALARLLQKTILSDLTERAKTPAVASSDSPSVFVERPTQP
jgi:hypothetical protein